MSRFCYKMRKKDLMPKCHRINKSPLHLSTFSEIGKDPFSQFKTAMLSPSTILRCAIRCSCMTCVYMEFYWWWKTLWIIGKWGKTIYYTAIELVWIVIWYFRIMNVHVDTCIIFIGILWSATIFYIKFSLENKLYKNLCIYTSLIIR